ncbi:hypothetical protein SODALDRAFT_354449 [Sodiomyces alkalinus F11]|uniref:F-box domain-containing protein n=1 Tax=Sodiomyces alkalinus (strain CBS 110278 / VKM F-3762 / F11) TaxID=1314773 RepID=A0A3N2Q6A9_SODAK|nr:hypothetical protein SODALDRAFT_354449 [Sodiomyces alkalinus F11]ROT42319.1 hypothetical protein SODALDRAFT_354449 [Sodiomyces alkalinus F11]
MAKKEEQDLLEGCDNVRWPPIVFGAHTKFIRASLKAKHLKMESDPRLDSELESFRQQWRSELQAKKPWGHSGQRRTSHATTAASSSQPAPRLEAHKASIPSLDYEDPNEDYVQTRSFDEPAGPSSSGGTLADTGTLDEKELFSALDHFEAAVEKEAVGSLGDSLKLYRKAFRMDSHVDMLYRKKYFPGPLRKPSESTPGSGLTKVPAKGSSAADNLEADQPQSIKDLVASFSDLSIASAPPPVEGDAPPPCPIADIPQEVLAHILTDLAVLDIGDFVRLSVVCKRFAYLVAADDQIWRRVCLGREFGFQGMHYHWQAGVAWEPLPDEGEVGEEGEFVTMEELARRRREENLAITVSLYPEYGSSWQRMFRHRPRIRFNGCYISTVNYIRPGQASANQITWNTPVHIITYYRYLRFFRDGTVISLLTTAEPGDVVHHMTKDLLAQHRGGAAPHLSSVVLQHGLRGRWRLSSVLDHPDGPDGVPNPKDAEGELFVETEGVGPKYMYRMNLSLRSAGRGTRNNKLVWKGFYSYNKLTDDWAEFGLKNDKPFFFSRASNRLVPIEVRLLDLIGTPAPDIMGTSLVNMNLGTFLRVYLWAWIGKYSKDRETISVHDPRSVSGDLIIYKTPDYGHHHIPFAIQMASRRRYCTKS